MTLTLGQLLINDLLPAGSAINGPVTKKDLNNKMLDLAKENTPEAARRIDALRRLGHELSTTTGVSATLDDITPDYATRDKIVKPTLQQLQHVEDLDERRAIIKQTQQKLLEASKDHPGSFGMMVRSGARGKPVQLMKTVAAPVMALTHTGEPVPWLVPRSYAEGLRTSEIWATHIETRNNQIDTRLAVTEPGDMGKILVNNMADQMVTTDDCGTRNGVMMSVDDSQTADRFLARAEGGFSKDTITSPRVLTKLKSKGIRSVMVRSPMTCESKSGVCQKCFGLNQAGKTHDIGTNVGIRSAQALAEPLTQFALSAKHGVRSTVDDAAKVQGHKGFRQLLDVPQNFANKAGVAPEDGVIDRIEKAPQGGYFIHIGENQMYTAPGFDPIVKENQQVLAGDVITKGIANPADIVRHKGLGAGRQYLVDQIQSLYKNQGVNIDRRHLELLTKAHLNRVRVDHDPEGRFFPGEPVEYNKLLGQLQEEAHDVPLDKAAGKVLGGNSLHFTAGTRITPDVIDALKSAKVKAVPIMPNMPQLTPIMRPIVRNPLLNPDWIARLGHRYLTESLLQGAHFGEKSDIHGQHPIPAIAYGAEFGKGQGGNY